MAMSPDSLRSYFDDFYKHGDFDHYPEESDFAFFRAIFSYFSIPVASRILDAGSGSGVRLLRINKLGMNGYGIDLSFEGLKVCRDNAPDVPLLHADILSIPLKDSSFRAVIALGCSVMNSVNYESIVSMIHESLRIVEDGGWVIATSTSTFRDENKSGWRSHKRAFFAQLLHDIEASDRKLFYTAPGIANKWPKLTFHPFVSWLFYCLPFYKRTIVMGWQK
jgi:SAM-dependent methyltransferase